MSTNLLLATRKTVPADQTGQYILNYMTAQQNSVVTTAPFSINPTNGIHNGWGSLEFTGGKAQFGGGSTADYVPPAWMFAAGANFDIRFNVYPYDQNLSVLMGDLNNQQGRGSWFVALNRLTSLPQSNVEFDVWDGSATKVFSFNIGSRLPINTWTDIAIERRAGVIRCKFNGVYAPESYTYNAAAIKPTGTGPWALGRSNDSATNLQYPFKGMINQLYINMNA